MNHRKYDIKVSTTFVIDYFGMSLSIPSIMDITRLFIGAGRFQFTLRTSVYH